LPVNKYFKINKVVIGDDCGQIKIYNEKLLVNSFEGHSTYIRRIKQCPFKTNTHYVATCSHDKKVKIWNVHSSYKWTLFRTYSEHSSTVDAVEWLDKDTLASAGYFDLKIKIWSPKTGQTKRTINTNGEVRSLKMLNAQIYLTAGLSHGDIEIYNINDGSLVSSLKGHGSYVWDLVQMSDKILASSSGDKTVRIWDLSKNTCNFILTGHTDWVYGLKQITWSILASGSDDKTIKLWNTSSGQLIRTLTGHTNWIRWSVELLNSETLVSGSWDQTIKLWNWSTGECFRTIQTNSCIYSLVGIGMIRQ
jgi:WD40 repeat protein